MTQQSCDELTVESCCPTSSPRSSVPNLIDYPRASDQPRVVSNLRDVLLRGTYLGTGTCESAPNNNEWS